MPFPYYQRLPARAKAIYQQSDRVSEIRLARPDLLRPFVQALRLALEREDRKAVEASASLLCRGITQILALPPVVVQVLAVRPSSKRAELHGLYTPGKAGSSKVQLWMRTAKKRRVVAFRTFVRTFLHEMGHHLDYHHLKLADSFHTEGFFQRESSLFRQLLPEEEVKR